MFGPRPAHRVSNLVLAHDDDLRIPVAQDGEGDWRAAHRLQRVAQCRRRVAADALDRAAGKRARHVVPSFGLGANDPRVRTGERHPRGKPAAADRNRDQRRFASDRLPELVEDFEPDGALAGNHMTVVERGYDGGSGPGRKPGGNRHAVLGPAVIEHHVASVGAGAVDFDLRRIARHDDRRLDAEAPSRNRHALRMIAGGESHHAALAFGRVELEQAVARSAQLERAAGLQGLAFEPDPAARELRLDQWRSNHLPRDPRRSRDDIASFHANPLSPLAFRPTVPTLRHMMLAVRTTLSKKLYIKVHRPYIAASAAPWDFQPQGSFSRTTLGGPLSCTTILARWG